MEKYEAVAKTADEAIEQLLSQMKVTIDEIDIEMEEVRKGFFGISKQIKVTATLKNEAKPSAKPTEAPIKEARAEQPAIREKKELAVPGKAQEKDFAMEEAEDDDRIGNPDLINDPEDIIREFIGNLSENTGGISEVNVKVDENTVKIDISGEDVSLLIGKHGKTLDAIRNLLSLMINRGRAKNDLKRVLLDVEGYRKKRDNTLERLARSTATKVIKTNKEIAMEPMNPYERRIIHSVLQRNKLVSTRSEGEEPSRYVVVFLK